VSREDVMTIGKRLIALAAVGLVAVIALGLVGYIGSRNINDGIARMATVSSGLRNHLDTDMLHDALRADVLSALVAQNDEARTEAVNEVAEHSKQIKELLEANEQLDLGAEAHQALAETRPRLDVYTATAQREVELAAKDHAGAQAAFGEFQTI